MSLLTILQSLHTTSGNESEYSDKVSKTIAPRAIYSISGTVNESGDSEDVGVGGPLTGATVTLTGDASAATTTDASGNYTFSGLSNGSYTVTPSLAGYTFSPTSSPVTISGANRTGQDFTGIATSGGIYSIETPEKEETVQEETTIEPFPAESVGSEEISPPSDIYPSEFSKKQVYSIQVGAFANERNAVSLVDKLKQKGYKSFILRQSRPGGKILHKVLIGKFDRRKEALESSRILLQKQGIETFIYSYYIL